MTYVMGLDPGRTTGVCLLNVRDKMPAHVIDFDEIKGGTEGFIDWAQEATDWPRHVVCESFNLDGRTPKPDLTPVEIIGALKVLITPGDLIFQTNTEGKHLMTNDVLKRAGYYPERGKVGGGHSVDALRHALTYVVKTLKHRPTIEKLYPKV